MKSISQKSSISPGIVIAVFSLVILCVGIIFASRAQAASNIPSAGERLITIHDRGRDRGIITRATTLRDVFKAASIEIDPNDTVEPGLDETLIANNYEVNVYRARPVTIIDGAVREKVMSPYRTAKQIAEQAKITLQDEDIATITANTDMVSQGAGVQISIDRAAAVNFVLYGTKMTIYTQGDTVADILKQKKITLGKDDTLSVPQTTKIVAGMSVELWRNGKQIATEEQDIAFPTEKIQDVNREVGFKEVKTAGEKGKRSVTFEIEMKNGKEVARKEILSVVVTEPKKQVEVIGAKPPTPTNPSEAAQLGHQMMLAYGFGEDQWSCLYNLWMRESGWRTTASNPSGAYGIPQALPGSKMGVGWQADASVQIQWGLGYIKGRYVTPCGAWSSFLAKGWY